MPSTTFKGFALGSAVAISAVQGANSASESVSTWGQAAMANVDILTVAPGVVTAPAGIWFEAIGLSGFNVPGGPAPGETYDPSFHEITYVWTVRNAPLPAHAAPQNMVTGWNDANTAYGKKVALHFTAPGTYIVDLWAVDRLGITGTASTTFTVADADSLYPGTSTVCYSNAPGENWAGEKPGCQRATSFGALQSAIDSASGPLRILFKRGQEVLGHQTGRLLANASGEWMNHIGTWGSGAKPIINCMKGTSVLHIGGPSNPITHFTVENIDFRGGWNAATETGVPSWTPFNFVSSPTVCHYTVSQCNFDGLDNIWLGIGHQASTMVLADCVITNWRDYGFFIHDSGNVSGTRMAFVGTRIQQNVDAQNGAPASVGNPKNGFYNMHGPIRYSDIQNFYIGNCDLFSRNGWSALGSTKADQPCIRANGDGRADRFFTMDRCVCEGGFKILAFEGQNGTTAENPGNYLVDKALLIATGKTTSSFIAAEYGGVTVRNTIGVMPNVPAFHPSNSWPAAIQLGADAPGPGNLNAEMQFYGNTFVNLRDTGNDPGDSWGTFSDGVGFNNVVSENNVLHGPLLDTPVTAGQTIDLATPVPGVSPRYKGVLYNEFGQENGTLGATVANGSSFTLPYPSGTSQSYWQAIQGTDTQHTLILGGGFYYADLSEISVTYEPTVIRVTNTSGATWNSGSGWQLKLDRKSLKSAIPTTYANPSSVPLPRPAAAIGTGLGLFPYHDFEAQMRGAPATEGALKP